MYSDSEEVNGRVKAIEIIQINLMSTWERQMKFYVFVEKEGTL